ncbi:MAG: hypothetical protein CMM94_07640, partial [Rickettsiales bacterium]|nr:hypothetical protein [Rickettsiales bacterium]
MAQDNEEPIRIDPDTDSQELDPRVRDALRAMMRDGDDYTRYGSPPQDRNWRNPEFDRFQQAPERPDTSAGGIVNAIRSGTVGDMIGQELSARQYEEMQRRAEQSE